VPRGGRKKVKSLWHIGGTLFPKHTVAHRQNAFVAHFFSGFVAHGTNGTYKCKISALYDRRGDLIERG
jgi:hypothetical protein